MSTPTEVLEARWTAVTTRILDQYENGDPAARCYTTAMAKGWDRIEHIVRNWAVVVYGDHISGEDAVEALDQFTGEIFEAIHAATIEYATAQILRTKGRFANAGQAA